MRLLSDILYKVSLKKVIGPTNVAIENLSINSKETGKLTLFIAIKGTNVDGHNFIDSVIRNGVQAIVCERIPEEQSPDVTYVVVSNTKKALGIISSNYYDQPSTKMSLVGITGTNGKTTVATLLYDLFRDLGKKVGLISTVVYKINRNEFTSTHTTPDAIKINQLLAKMVEDGCKYCFMEVSSHAADQERIHGLEFAGGVFTNITHDHLDYHKDFNSYIRAKKKFFDILPGQAFALVNKDDPHWMDFIKDTKAEVKSFALKAMADYKAKIVETSFEGTNLNINGKDLWAKLLGGFNAYNLLAVCAVATLLGEEEMSVLTSLSALNSVEGRFQYLKSKDGITAVVDYAHTPDALKNILKSIKDIVKGNEKVITVVGCGGNRDAEKRPVMGKIAAELSDKVVFTSDNPRGEDPVKIIEEMEAGIDKDKLGKIISNTNRKQAIKMACVMAVSGDVVLVAGKGHEKYQEINGQRFDFDDFEVIRDVFNQLEK